MLKKIVKQVLQLPKEVRVIPTYYKNPLVKAWQKRENNYSPPELVNQIIANRGWFRFKNRSYAMTGYGLVTGNINLQGFLIALDCDSPEAIAQINQLQLPQSVEFTSGRVGKKQVLYYLEQGIPSFKDRKISLEIRGQGHFSVLPPSIHPLTKQEYYWLTPQNQPIAQINSERILSLYQHYPITSNPNNRNSSLKARKILTQIDYCHGSNYHNWIAIGMALFNCDHSLLADWDLWSSHCEKYRPGECPYKWNSFRKTHGYTIATLYYFAQKSCFKQG